MTIKNYEDYKVLADPLAEELHEKLEEIVNATLADHSSECGDDNGMCPCECENVIAKVFGGLSTRLLIASRTHCIKPIDFAIQANLKECILASLQNSINVYNEWHRKNNRKLN